MELVFQVFLGYLGLMEEMEPRATKDLWEHPAKWDLKDPTGPKATRAQKANKLPRSLIETGNNVRGRILMLEKIMG